MVKENVSLADMTTMGVGGRARRVVYATCAAEFAEAVAGGGHVLGRGSNIVASDRGFDGTLVLAPKVRLQLSADGVYADAGVSLSSLAAFCKRNGLTGLEWAAGIPGSVGGAAVMNAGAFGGQFSDTAVYVDTVDGRLDVGRCGFGYRASNIAGAVTGACFKVAGDEPERIAARIRKLAAVRRATQPQGKSAGSVFKAADKPAAVYIDGAGLKGLRIGGATVSVKHANFIINEGNATAADIVALVKRIREVVFERYAVILEEEIRYLGEF